MNDYSAVRDGGAGVIDLSSRGRLLVSGSEAVAFLNGLITNDMKTLAVNSWMPAVFPNVQGRLIAAVRIIHRKGRSPFEPKTPTLKPGANPPEDSPLPGHFGVKNMPRKT